MIRAFLLGVICGIGLTLYAIGRSMGTPASRQHWIDEEWRVPIDPYVDGIPW